MNGEKKKTRKKFVIILIIIAIIAILICIAPFLIFCGSVFWEMFFAKPSEPAIVQGEFPFEIVYEYNKEERIITGTIVCEYEGSSFALDGGNTRNWECYIENNDDYGRYQIDVNIPDLYIEVPLAAEYYMGEPETDMEMAKPYIYYSEESTGTIYYEQDLSNVVGAKIIRYNLCEPIENTFK